MFGRKLKRGRCEAVGGVCYKAFKRQCLMWPHKSWFSKLSKKKKKKDFPLKTYFCKYKHCLSEFCIILSNLSTCAALRRRCTAVVTWVGGATAWLCSLSLSAFVARPRSFRLSKTMVSVDDTRPSKPTRATEENISSEGQNHWDFLISFSTSLSVWAIRDALLFKVCLSWLLYLVLHFLHIWACFAYFLF